MGAYHGCRRGPQGRRERNTIGSMALRIQNAAWDTEGDVATTVKGDVGGI